MTSEAFDKAVSEAAIKNYAEKYPNKIIMGTPFEDGANFVKPMLMEAIEALEFYSAMRYNQEKAEWMPGSPDKAINALTNIKKKLGVEE